MAQANFLRLFTDATVLYLQPSPVMCGGSHPALNTIPRFQKLLLVAVKGTLSCQDPPICVVDFPHTISALRSLVTGNFIYNYLVEGPPSDTFPHHRQVFAFSACCLLGMGSLAAHGQSPSPVIFF